MVVLPVYLFVFFLFSEHVLPLSSAYEEYCPSFFDCGNLGKLRFPFTTPKHNNCGMLAIHGSEDPNPNAIKVVQFGEKMFQVRSFDPIHKYSVILRDTALQNSWEKDDCHVFCCNITLSPTSPFGSFEIFPHQINFYKCNISMRPKVSPPKQFLNYTGCSKSNNETIFFQTQDQDGPPPSLVACPGVQLPVNKLAFSADPFTFIASEFSVKIQLSDYCFHCSEYKEGICLLDSKGASYCSKSKVMHNK